MIMWIMTLNRVNKPCIAKQDLCAIQCADSSYVTTKGRRPKYNNKDNNQYILLLFKSNLKWMDGAYAIDLKTLNPRAVA